MIEKAIEKIRKEAGEDRFLRMIAAQAADLMKERGSAGRAMEEGKTLEELKKIFDKFALEHKERGRSVIMPDEAAEMICDYYEIDEKREYVRMDILDML